MGNNNVHSGHRSRMYESFVRAGSLEGFSDIEIVEMVLFYSVTRANTSNIAHKYTDIFEGAEKIFQASPGEIRQRLGCSAASARILSIVGRYREIVSDTGVYKGTPEFSQKDIVSDLESFEKDGTLKNLALPQILDIFLWICVPKNKVYEISGALKEEFSNIREIFMLPPAKILSRAKYLSQKAACFLAMPFYIQERFDLPSEVSVPVFDDIKKITNHLLPYFKGKKEEMIYMMCLDEENKEINTICIEKGGMDFVETKISDFAIKAVACKSKGVVFAHNHPSGMVTSSFEDVRFTNAVIAALKSLRINFLDHIVFSEENFYSFSQNVTFKL